MDITAKDYAKFTGQAVFQTATKLGCAVAGLPIIAVGLFFTKKPDTHPFYDFVEYNHRQVYIDRGSSGIWEYEKLPDWWIMKAYDNLNYGLLGEYYGRWSSLRDGDERSYASKFRQAAIRNPANGLRYMEPFSCQVDNCDIVYKGDYGPLDIQPELVEGWNFVKAKDRDSGKLFYSFQWVKGWGKKKKHAFRVRIGFKVEPSHIDRGDIRPSKERATFTMRINPWKAVDAWEK